MFRVAPNSHLAQFVLARRQPCVVLIVQSDEKSDCASEALWFLEVTLNVGHLFDILRRRFYIINASDDFPPSKA